MAGRISTRSADEDPDYEEALAKYVASLPEAQPTAPKPYSGANVESWTATPTQAETEAARFRTAHAGGGGAPPPMTQPAAALDGLMRGASMPTRAEQIAKVTAEGGDLTPFITQPAPDARQMPQPFKAPPPTPEGEAMLADLEAAGKRGASLEDQPLPDVSMPLPGMPAPAQVPPGLERPNVKVGKAAHVNVPRTAVAETADRGPSGAAPATPVDPVMRALTALALSAKPQGGAGEGDLDAALRAASGRRWATEMTRAGAMMVGRGNDPAYAQAIANADRPVEEFQMRRSMSQQYRQQVALQAAADAARRKESFQEEMGRGELKVKQGSEAETERHNRAMEAAKARKSAVGGAGGLKPHEVDQDFQKFGEAISTVHGRSNLNRERQESLDRADRLSALVLGPDGDVANLDNRQVREAATSLAALIAQGGPSAVSQIDELVPHTLAGQWAALKEKYSGKPEGADMQDFLRRMLETAGRETKVIKGQIHQGQTQSVPTFAHLKKSDPARYAAMLKANGLDPATFDDSGLERAGAPTIKPGAPTAPVQVHSVAEYNALPAGTEYIDPNGKRKRKGG